jgi:Tol biopolymer transport system component
MTIRALVTGLAILLLLAGCQPAADEQVLPTAADLNMLATDDAATAAVLASPTRRPLPPTFTPSPPPSATPFDPAILPTPTPEGFRAAGTIYFVFNGNSIVELAADRSFEDLLPIPHIGQPITGLALSPDDNWLAYVAPGAGSAFEVYITDRKGINTRRVSELGFGVMLPPVWKSDSSALAFVAAQSPEAPRSIYLVNADGSGQRPLVQLPSLELRDIAWSSDGNWLFFSNPELYAVNVVTGEITGALTQFTGYGPDFSPVHSPTRPELYYLKPRANLETGQRGGVLSFIITSDLPDVSGERRGAQLYVDKLTFSRDGNFLLIADEQGIWVQDQTNLTTPQILADAPAAPRPAFSPDAEQVAFVGLDALGAEQVFVMSRRGEAATQLTFHQEGAINDLQWAAG